MPVKLNSSGGGSVTLTTPSTASDFTVTMPAATGTAALTASPTFTGTTTTGAQSVGGNITFSLADAGIIFNNSGKLSNPSATLNDYEVGTWTPVIVGLTTAGSCSYSIQDGKYTKVGAIVVATFDISTTSTPTGTGVCAISGLPFIANGTSQATLGGGSFYWTNVASSLYCLSGYGDAGQSRIVLMGQTSAAGTIQYVNPNIFTSGARTFGLVVYRSSF